jgi:protein SCO1/2
VNRRLLLGALSALVGCAGSDVRSGALRGIELPEPWPKPAFTLTDTRGEPFAFRERTAGKVTLLFFGYTHCPDICPVHMANLAAVLAKLPPAVANEVAVVFVSTDPERDTGNRIRSWLDGFDPAFIGLRGSLDSVNVIQQEIGLAAAVPGERTAADGYLVGHAAQVVAYTKDDSAHVVYPSRTRQTDWAHDLPRLVTRR